MSSETVPNLKAYLDRVGLAGPIEPTLSGLQALHYAHATTLPFENLDIQLGRPIRLDLASLEAKLIDGRRGGYCFEQNTYFAAVLRLAGFKVTTLAARVRYLATGVMPKTHMVLAVDLPEGRHIADVGFGGVGLTGPLRLVLDEEQPLPVDTYRFRRDAAAPYVLQARLRGEWSDLYAFTEEEHFPVDFEVANHFTSTHPESRFVTGLVVALPTRSGERLVLRGRHFTIRQGDSIVEERDLSDDELLVQLRDGLGLDFAPGTRFRALTKPG